MARINIEDCWWSDPRRSKLVKLFDGDSRIANGLAAEAWRLAQEFWKHDRALIPLKHFEALEGSSKLIEAGLAVLRDGSVYVCGSSTYLEWVHDKREAGRLGGQKSAETRRKKTGSAQPKRRSTPEAEMKHAEPSFSSSSSSSSSSSFSDSGSEISKDEISKTTASPNAGAFIATYCRSWKAKYGSRPEITGRERGIAKRLCGDIGTERASNLVEAFLQMQTQWFVTKRHDLATFEQNLNAVVQFHDTGVQISQTQARAADGMAHAQDQLRRIAEGSL